MNAYGFTVIGQARIDTRLYEEPPVRKLRQRGRSRKYGERYTPQRVAHFTKTEAALKLYGKEQKVRYRSRLAKVRFIDGQLVRAVCCELDRGNDQWTKTRLFLSTDPTLTSEQVIEDYGMRWSIESMYYQLKELWGFKEMCQQRRQTLHRWVHLMTVGVGLLHLLTLALGNKAKPLVIDTPWRGKDPITAGRIKRGLKKHFCNVNVRSGWNGRCKKFQAPAAVNYVPGG